MTEELLQYPVERIEEVAARIKTLRLELDRMASKDPGFSEQRDRLRYLQAEFGRYIAANQMRVLRKVKVQQVYLFFILQDLQSGVFRVERKQVAELHDFQVTVLRAVVPELTTFTNCVEEHYMRAVSQLERLLRRVPPEWTVEVLEERRPVKL